MVRMGSFRLGSVLGIEVRIHFSWFVIFLLILWTFSQGIFPADYPGLSAWTYYVMGVAGALLFFASLLAHELSHSVVARRRGVAVEGITLFIFGGMARTRMDSRTAGDEFVIAGVGPLSSVVLAIAFGIIAWAGARLGVTPAVTGVAEYVGYLNAMLALFNLLPGYPLDGGRLLRSAVWKATGDLRKATRIAASGGTLLAYALIVYGAWQGFHGQLLDGLWLVFIGWFVRNAARAGYRQFVVVHALEGVPAWQAMTRWPETLPPDLTLRRAVEDHFRAGHFRAFPVVSPDGRALGLVTLEQVRSVAEPEWSGHTVGEVMIPASAVQVAPEESMARVLDRLGATSAGRLLVTRDGRLEGIIAPADVAAWIRGARELKRI